MREGGKEVQEKFIVKYDLLSKYRTQLMGLAMIWVVLYHIKLPVVPNVLQQIKNIGYGGVDIFLFLSGMGLYMSVYKDSSIKNFYERRVKRIFPKYILVVLLFSLILIYRNEIGAKELFLNLLSISFFLNISKGPFGWFIPSLLVLYLVTPLYIKVFKKVDKKECFTYGVIGIVLVLCVSLANMNLSYLLIFISRIPIFIIGILFGYNMQINKYITKKQLLIYVGKLIAGSILLVIAFEYFPMDLWKYGLFWYPFILITPALCIFISLLLDKVVEKCQIINKILIFWGKNSLDIYLIHAIIMPLFYYQWIEKLNIKEYLNYYNIVIIVLHLCLVGLFKKLEDRNYNMINLREKGYVHILKYLITIVILGGIVVIALYDSQLSFDGAMNVQVSQSLLEDGMYTTRYDGGIVFDEKIQSGITLLAPTALIMKIFGTNNIAANTANIIYIILLLVMVARVLSKYGVSNLVIFCTEICFLATPYFFEYGNGLYGEIPMLFWIILVIYILNKGHKNKYYFIAGVCYGLAYLTKTVALIALPALVIYFLYHLLISKEIKIKQIIIWLIGVLGPIILFEIYKIILLGSYEYGIWWRQQIESIMQQAGVTANPTYQDTENIITKFFVHLDKFSEYFSIDKALVCIIVIANFGMWCYRIYKEKTLKAIDILYLVAFSYFGWWFLITSTQKAWARRIIVGVLLMELTSLYNCFYYIKLVKMREEVIRYLKIITGTVVTFTIILVGTQAINLYQKNRIEDLSMRQVVSVIKQIREDDKNAIFCGYGWWQAPRIAFNSGEKFANYYKLLSEEKSENIYLVIDKYAKLLSGSEYNDVLDLVRYDIIYEDNLNYNYIYKINEFLPYKAFSEEEKLMVNENTYNMREKYKYTRGIYDYEENAGLAWSKKDSSILLKNNLGTNDVYLELLLEVRNYNLLQEKPKLEIYIDNELVSTVTELSEGTNKEVVHLQNLNTNGQVLEIKLKFNTQLQVENDARELAYILKQAKISRVQEQ